MTKDIIFYSNYCTYSKEIINQISKTTINDTIIYVSVDDENIKLPPFVKAVPTIYLVNDKKIVVDEEIENWIKSKTSKQVSEELQPYFGTCGDSFGASCSNIDNTEIKPFTSGFTFLGEEQQITTSTDEKPKNGTFDNKYEQIQSERNNEFNSIQRQ
tara:strand:+ start:1826 stop:2296 length:471 start_codon:yes stop_codon:yes gene_type:complete